MGEFRVQGFPTVKMYIGGVWIDYNLERSAASVVDWAMKQLTQSVKSKLTGGRSSSSGGKASANDAIELTDRNFNDQLLKDEKNVWFVMFYAPWCGHCKTLKPVWDELATKVKGKAKIAKVDATKEKSTADKFQIRGAAIGGSSISGSSIDWWRIDCRAFDALVNRQINQEERSKRIVGSMSIR
eukprot:GHVU01194299.1.p1 GENE.GHVU01194299.1~~GHVU01194299.1.p1  ORF type:complete len:184 (-),score=38.54 GHVU01194299.1:40-591(-)